MRRQEPMAWQRDHENFLNISYATEQLPRNSSSLPVEAKTSSVRQEQKSSFNQIQRAPGQSQSSRNRVQIKAEGDEERGEEMRREETRREETRKGDKERGDKERGDEVRGDKE
ncbi:hypothetical protein WMY93_006175 [Mugilogobius chulae]|uniref:Uncharacterized protein n=1 Tax=Mugilogobius chulae TaxID=88201 RepID=A0AAW0PJC4_9GOBI